MGVEFYQDKSSQSRWKVVDQDGELVHDCHESFVRIGGATNNMFVNHALMGIFINTLVKGGDLQEEVYFEDDKAGKARWKMKSANGEIVGVSHKGFDTKSQAFDNLVSTYTLLSIYVAGIAASGAYV